MFLRSYKRKKNGKWHEYFSVVENRRVANGGTIQRTVLYRFIRLMSRWSGVGGGYGV